MARAKSGEKRSAILQAAVEEIALAGLGAPTANIARRAGVASGTLFTYFATKEELLNELYLELKNEVYARVNANFPHHASLKERARHVWANVLDWAIAYPDQRKVSVQLNVSDRITSATRKRAAAGRGAIDKTFSDLAERATLRGLPSGFAAATMSAMQETAMDFIGRRPRQRKALIERAFELFWRAVQ